MHFIDRDEVVSFAKFSTVVSGGFFILFLILGLAFGGGWFSILFGLMMATALFAVIWAVFGLLTLYLWWDSK